MNISAIQAKLLLSQIGTKELTKANVAQNTKVIQKDEKNIDKKSQYTENDINDTTEISDEAVNKFNNERDKYANDSMELDKKEQTPKTDTNTVQNTDALMYMKACRAYRKAC